jgi:hypothetical protein
VSISAGYKLGAVWVVLALGLTTAAVLGLVASLRLRGLQRLTGATCLLSASACVYLAFFTFWLTFE